MLRLAWFLIALLLASAPALAGEGGLRAYCYRTLADVVCYTAPDPGRERRFVGFFDLPGDWRRVPATHERQAGSKKGPRSLLPAPPARRDTKSD